MQVDLGALIQGKLFAFLLVFARVGAVMVSMPGIGETFVPPRVRLQFALLVSFILLPLLAAQLPPPPETLGGTAQLLVTELGIGLYMGIILRLLLSTLETVGMLISIQTGLSNSLILNPTIQSQGSLTGAVLTMMGLVFIFESGLIDMILRSFAESYRVFQPGRTWMIGDLADFFTQTIARSFALALQLAAPFMILGIVFQFAGGLMVKMIPQMQIFFVMAPLQIIFGIAMFALVIGTVMAGWARGFEQSYLALFTGG